MLQRTRIIERAIESEKQFSGMPRKQSTQRKNMNKAKTSYSGQSAHILAQQLALIGSQNRDHVSTCMQARLLKTCQKREKSKKDNRL